MNNITGGIPREIGNMSQLQALDLSLNHIVGEIPKELGKLNSLTKLIFLREQRRLSKVCPCSPFGSGKSFP